MALYVSVTVAEWADSAKKKKKVFCFHTTLQNRLFQTPMRCILKSISQNASVPWPSEECSDAELGLGLGHALREMHLGPRLSSAFHIPGAA